jgi:hypothetical protein
VGLIVKRDELRMKFFVAMISLGVLGASCCALGYRIAFG